MPPLKFHHFPRRPRRRFRMPDIVTLPDRLPSVALRAVV